MNKLLLLILSFLALDPLQAQTMNWAQTTRGEITGGRTTALQTDKYGNNFTAGYVVGQGLIDDFAIGSSPTDTTYFLASPVRGTGSYNWVFPMDPGVSISAIAVGDGHVYIAGSFKSAIHGDAAMFDYAGQHTLISDGEQAILFVAKFAIDGWCQWVKEVGKTTLNRYEPFVFRAMAIHPSGNIVLTGSLRDPSNLDDYSLFGYIEPQFFISQLNSSGEVMWVKEMQDSEYSNGYDVDTDDLGNSYVTGNVDALQDKVLFDSHEVSTHMRDIFIAKYNAAGACLWVKTAGVANELTDEFGSGIEVDAQGNSYTTGMVGGATKFDTLSVTNSRTPSLFVAKYSPEGKCLWVKSSRYSIPFEIQPDIALRGDKLYVTGGMLRSFNLEGQIISSANYTKAYDFFLAKFYTDGTLHWLTNGGVGMKGYNEQGKRYHISAGINFDRVFVAGTTIPGSFGEKAGNGPIYIAEYSDNASCISGTIFNDANGNGLMDSSETPVPLAVIEVSPGPYYAVSNLSGEYRAYTPAGNYTAKIGKLPAHYQGGDTTTHRISFTTRGQTSGGNHFALEGQAAIIDGRVSLSSNGFIRPGFESSQIIEVRNMGTALQNGKLQLTLDGHYEYLSSQPAATLSGNVLTWEYTGLSLLETRTFSVKVKLATTLALGTSLSSTAALTPEGGDANPANNSFTLSSTVVGSYDPNDKAVSDTILSPQQVSEGKYLEYTIRFQNKGTAEAIFVTLKDTLSEKLDVATVEIIGASHPYKLKLSDKGALEWFFDNINLAAEMHDEPGSHGFIRYRILPKKGLQIGEVIENKAFIYFDYNAPIVTNVSSTKIDRHTQTLSFAPIGDKTYGDAPFALQTSSGTGKSAALAILSGPATISENMLKLTGSGQVTLRARVEGDEHYASVEVEQTFIVHKAMQTITVKALGDKILNSDPLSLQGSSSADLPLSYGVVSGSATLQGNTLTLEGPGTVVLKAMQKGDTNYLPAEEVTLIFCVLPAKPIISAEGSLLSSSASEGNEWYKDGVAIMGARAQSFTATEKGEYRVKVKGPCGEGQTSEAFIVTVAGIREALMVSVKLYPNPASREVTIELPQAMSPERIILLTTTGKMVRELEISAMKGEYSISTSGLAKGIYLLQIETASGNMIKKLIIK